jgi:hypothetical protein
LATSGVLLLLGCGWGFVHARADDVGDVDEGRDAYRAGKPAKPPSAAHGPFGETPLRLGEDGED